MPNPRGDSWDARRLADVLRDLAADRPLSIRVSGVCMAPRIADGAMVQLTPGRYYWPGDVLVFVAADGRMTAHRLVGAWGWGGSFRLFTRADRGSGLDAAIRYRDVIGRVVGGDCALEIARVPITQRVSALLCFIKFALRRALARMTTTGWRPRR